jgi:AraC-like DNA-binding protein
MPCVSICYTAPMAAQRQAVAADPANDSLVEVGDVDTYFADPRWRILRYPGFFCSSPDGKILTLWAVGHTDLTSCNQLLDIFAAVERARLGPRRQLVALRHLHSVSAGAMERFVRYHQRVTAYVRGVSHEGVVRPEGVAGILAEGFYRTIRSPTEGRVFTDLNVAAEWVGVDDRAWLAAAQAEEAKLLAAWRRVPEGLDAIWDPAFMRLTLPAAAAALSLAPRTLQRRLRESSTTFEDLRLRATLNRADELLLIERDVKDVAYTLGFSSPSAFSTAFRRARGLSPEQWRAQARAVGSDEAQRRAR